MHSVCFVVHFTLQIDVFHLCGESFSMYWNNILQYLIFKNYSKFPNFNFKVINPIMTFCIIGTFNTINIRILTNDPKNFKYFCFGQIKT